MVEAEIGLPLEAFIDLVALILTASTRDSGWLRLERLNELRIAYGDELERAMRLLAKTPSELREWLRREFPPAGNRSRELNQFPVFKRVPIVKFSSHEYRLWHQSVLDRFVDEYLHLALSRHGEDYIRLFSKVFERYILELVEQSGVPFMTADEYLRQFCAGNSAKNVEAIMTDTSGTRRVLVEAKMGLFADDDLLQEMRRGTVKSLKNSVLKALAQGQAVSRRLRQEAGGDTEKHFLLVVTSRELHIGTGPMLRELCGDEALAPRDDGAENLLPINHVFVVSVHEFELLMSHVAAKRVDLFELLEDVAERCKDLGNSRYTLSEFYAPTLPRGGEATWMPKLLREEIEASTARISSKLSQVPVGASLGGGWPKQRQE
jgi:hypothetical protein